MSIEIKNVSKCFQQVRALERVTLTLEENKIIGLLGRNGAGKSTLLSCITNRLFPDEGEILVDGEPAQENDEAQSKIFLMSEKTYYPEGMKVKEALRWTQDFYPQFDRDFARQLADSFGLNLSSKIKGLSTGYLSIFKLVIALSVNVPYVLLDEPVLGLDANHRDLFYRILLARYAERPSTLVLSTHLIEEVSSVIEDVVIIKDGRILRNEPRETLLAGGYTVSGMAAAVNAYILGKDVIGEESIGGLKTAYLLGTADRKTLPEGLELSGMDLQKLFIRLTSM